MITSYGETSGFTSVSGVELTQINGGDVKWPFGLAIEIVIVLWPKSRK